jgi:hypothetical protein
MTIWILLKTAVSANLVPAQQEEIYEMFEEIKKGKRVYDALGRDVTKEVIETFMSWFEYDAGKIILEKRVCEFFSKLKSDPRPEDMVLAATIARFYGINIDGYTVAKAIWKKDPSLIPVPPVCRASR